MNKDWVFESLHKKVWFYQNRVSLLPHATIERNVFAFLVRSYHSIILAKTISCIYTPIVDCQMSINHFGLKIDNLQNSVTPLLI